MNNNQLKSDWGIHTPVPDVVLQLLPEIGAEDLALFTYSMYRVYKNRRKVGDFQLFPLWGSVERDTGMSRRKIERSMAVLEDMGLFVGRKRFGKSAIYMLSPPVEEIEPTAENKFATEWTDTAPSSLNSREQSLRVRDQFHQSEGVTKNNRTEGKMLLLYSKKGKCHAPSRNSWLGILLPERSEDK